MDTSLEFKGQVGAVFRVMGQDSAERIANHLLAELNDVAYKAIRKTGARKRLDERAIINDELYKKLDQGLGQAHGEIDFKLIKKKYEKIFDEKLGVCPISQCNVIDLMRAKDCMCLGLSIKRSEATITDPTKLIVKQVYPVYMSLDSFIESAIFNLKIN